MEQVTDPAAMTPPQLLAAALPDQFCARCYRTSTSPGRCSECGVALPA